jgi:hypothetical protein
MGPARSVAAAQPATMRASEAIVRLSQLERAAPVQDSVHIGTVQVTVRAPAPAAVAPRVTATPKPMASAPASRAPFRNVWLSRRRID